MRNTNLFCARNQNLPFSIVGVMQVSNKYSPIINQILQDETKSNTSVWQFFLTSSDLIKKTKVYVSTFHPNSIPPINNLRNEKKFDAPGAYTMGQRYNINLSNLYKAGHQCQPSRDIRPVACRKTRTIRETIPRGFMMDNCPPSITIEYTMR